jgi:digeranylgeranylglycerophospholipid reductase
MKYRIDFDFGSNTPWNIRREVFDNALLEAAREAGAEIFTDTRVSDVQFNGGVKVSTTKGDLRAQMAIGAMGPNDKLAQMVRKTRGVRPWNDGEIGTALMWEPDVGREFMERAYGQKRSLLVHFRPAGIEGYGWVFPKDTTLNIGFGGYNRTIKSINVREIWMNYLELLRKDGYFPKKDPDPPVKGAPLPLSGPLRATTMERTLIVGDSAGMVSPLSGEGIYYGMHAGKLAVETIQQALASGDFSQRALDSYHRAWYRTFGQELKDLSFFAKLALKFPERMVYYGTRDQQTCEIFADLFLGVTPGGLGKRRPIARTLRNIIRYPYFGWG